ncbi:probable glutamate receptor [Palaemon carinicauda]|uniref:probable glutamate receptor n=1 Tax=Palaemon carinicauda TaxID=392227 RepID=UPI0035B59206
MDQRYSDRPEVLDIRARLVWMWYQGMSARRISYETGLSTTTVYRWIRRWQEEGNVCTKSRSGRPRNEAKQMVAQYIVLSGKNKSLTTDELRDIMSYFQSVVPPHQSYILFDDTMEEMDRRIEMFHEMGSETTVMEFESDLDKLVKIFSSKSSIISTTRRHVTLLCSLNNTIKIFKMVAARNLENRALWWIVILTSNEETADLEGLFREGSQVIAIQKEGKDSFRLYSTRAENDGCLRFHDIGKLIKNANNGYKNQLTSDVFLNAEDFYSNFEGREITFSAVNNNPFIVLEKQNTGGVAAVAGFEHTLIKSLAKALNFSYRMVTPEDGKWGGPLPNGSVVGMIGDVAKRIAHFAICEITITAVREEVIDFSYPYYIESLTLVSRTPREKNRTFAVFSTFTPEVWLYIAISIILIGVLLHIEALIMQYSMALEQPSFTLNDSLFNVFGCLLKQENKLNSEFWNQKFTFVFWYIFCLIVSALYSGILIATLIKPTFDKPINGLIDLPSSVKEGFTLVITADTTNELLFKSATNGIYAETWKLFNHKERSKSFIKHSADSYDGILEDKLVLINGQLSSRYLSMDKGIRRYYFARDTFAPQFYGAAAISGLPFLPVVDKMLLYMMEGGLIAKWVDNEFQKVAGNNTIVEASGSKPFSIKQLQAAFYILVIGFITGTIAMIFEIVLANL